MHAPLVHLALSVALVLTSLACAAQPARASLDDLAGRWTLTHVAGEPVPAPGGPDAPGLEIAPDGRLSGSTGVNRFTGTLDGAALREGRFETGPLASTRRAGPPEAMELEQRFLRALDEADGARIDGDVLVLTRGTDELARFARVG